MQYIKNKKLHIFFVRLLALYPLNRYNDKLHELDPKTASYLMKSGLFNYTFWPTRSLLHGASKQTCIRGLIPSSSGKICNEYLQEMHGEILQM